MRLWSNPDSAARRRERRLAAGLRRSDPEALREVYEDYGGSTFGYLVSVMGDRAAAEDVQQEVFLEVWRRGAGYDPARGSLGTWILMMARSRAVDALRKRAPEPFRREVERLRPTVERLVELPREACSPPDAPPLRPPVDRVAAPRPAWSRPLVAIAAACRCWRSGWSPAS